MKKFDSLFSQQKNTMRNKIIYVAVVGILTFVALVNASCSIDVPQSDLQILDDENVTVSDDTLLSISESDNIRYDVPYFWEDYSKVYAVEDRATVIETVFKWSFDGQAAPKNGLTEINKYPHIKAKLDLLGKW